MLSCMRKLRNQAYSHLPPWTMMGGPASLFCAPSSPSRLVLTLFQNEGQQRGKESLKTVDAAKLKATESSRQEELPLLRV